MFSIVKTFSSEKQEIESTRDDKNGSHGNSLYSISTFWSHLPNLPLGLVQWIPRRINGWFCDIVASIITLCTANVL